MKVWGLGLVCLCVLYFSLGFDDKFGFEPDEDWKAILDYLNTL